MNAYVPRLARKLPVALWLMFQIPAMAVDLGFAAVMKGQEFAQTSADIVALGEWRTWQDTGEVQNEGEHPDPVHVFEAFGIDAEPDSLLSGTVTVPGGRVETLGRSGDQEDAELGIESGALSPFELNQQWPDGDYTLRFTGISGPLPPVTLTLAGGLHPPVPQITNFTALQAVNSATGAMVQWSPMGGGASDFIQMRIIARGGNNDGATIYQTGLPGMPGALNGTALQAAIPAGLLQAGRDYQGEVLFVKTVDIETSPALHVAGYYKLTGFRIRTAATNGTPLGSTLLRSNPQNGWSWVPVDSAVAFHFSHPMTPGDISINWTKDGGPLSTGFFNYRWTQGNTVLLCEFYNPLPPEGAPNNSMPSDSEIGWTLNLAGFKDAAGFALSGWPSGSFRTNMDMPESPPDVGFIGLFKTKYHIQTGTTAAPDGRYEAGVEVETNAPNRLKSATLTALANGRSGPLYADPWSGNEYEAPGEYGSKTDLDRFYPNGDYQFSFDGLGDGAQNVTLSLGATDQYPSAPTIANLAALQAIDPAAPVTIQWNALAGWSNIPDVGGGYIELEILDGYGTEVVWVEGSDLVSGTQYQLPAGTLKPGRSYQATLYFLRIADMDDTSYPGAFAVAAFESQTRFTIQTTGQPVVPVLSLQRIGGTARISAIGGELNMPYVLEASQNLQRWTPLARYWNNGAIYPYDDTDAQYLKARFYRVRESGPYEEVMPRISIQGTVWTNSSHTTTVAGAVVGTSLDARTAVTDTQGRFFLITDAPQQYGGAFYTITVSAGLQSRSFGPGNWGDQPRNQVFEME